MTVLEDQLRAYGLAGEPLSHAPAAWQPIVAAIRAANLDPAVRATAATVLTDWNADIDPDRVLLTGTPVGTFTATHEGELVAVVDDDDAALNLPPDNVQWDWGDGTGLQLDSSPQVRHQYTSPGRYTINKRAVVAGTVFGSAVEVEVGDVPPEPEPEPEPPVEPEGELPVAMFDPDDYTAVEVNAYADDHADDQAELEALLSMETSGKNRSTVISHLEALIEALG